MSDSISYWRQNVVKMDQKFYITYSLLGIALYNYMIGKKLSSQSWGNVAHYYSMVYSLRTLLFISIGDYPQSHRTLTKLFSRSNSFDWLSKFSSMNGFNRSYSPDQIIRYFKSETNDFSPEAVQVLKLMPLILEISKKTRNHENYDSLISFHHLNHRIITKAVEELTKSIEKSSFLFLTFMIKEFRNYVIYHPRSNYYRSFLCFSTRIKEIILMQKLEKNFEEELLHLLHTLDAIKHNDRQLYDEVADNTSLDNFQLKNDLMDRFRSTVSDLTKMVCDLQNLTVKLSD